MAQSIDRGGRLPRLAVWALVAAVGVGSTAGPAAGQEYRSGTPADQVARDPGGQKVSGPSTLVVKDAPATDAKAGGEAATLASVLKAMSAEARTFHMHVATLANPDFEGRVPGSQGVERARQYIERHFVQAGLEPAFAGTGEAGGSAATRSFRQPFRAGSQTIVQKQAASFKLPTATIDLTPGEQVTALGMSGTGTVTAPVVFVGYGIAEGPDGYTSFPADMDLAGRIALVFRFEPMDPAGSSLFTKGMGWSPAASLDEKIRAIASRQAAGIVLVNPPGADDPRAGTLITARDSLPFREALDIPVVMVSTEAAEKFVNAAGPPDAPMATLLSLRRIADELGAKGTIFPFNVEAPMTISADVRRDPVMAENVGGILPGAGPLKDEWVVIGAHHDHLGLGPVGAQPQNFGKLHPGADDNASGTAGVLMLAERLSREYASMGDTPRRSVLFLTFCAEESGLNGSRFYVNNPPAWIPNERISLMINLDMIGRLRPRSLEVQGAVSADGLLEMIKPIFDASGLEVRHGSTVASNSDHASFYNKNIPVLFFFTGLHREYHTPQDTFDTVNPEGGAQVVEIVRQTALAAATRAERLAFKERPRDQAQAGMGGVRTGVRFGIAPGTYSDDKPGIEVGDVFPNTPAAKAGIKTGDRLIKWNGAEVRTVEEWMPMLGTHKSGDVVDVTILRDGKEETMKVTLEARGQGNR